MKAYSIDLRTRVIHQIQSGMKVAEASRVFNIHRHTIENWQTLLDKQGTLEAKKGYQNGHSHKIKDLQAFCAYVDEHADSNQEELAEHFGVCSTTISVKLKKMNYTRKKNKKYTRSDTNANAGLFNESLLP